MTNKKSKQLLDTEEMNLAGRIWMAAAAALDRSRGGDRVKA
jgi:hypothetical protein